MPQYAIVDICAIYSILLIWVVRIFMSSPIEICLDRESRFAEFVAGPLAVFWHRREERQFTGVDGVQVSYVRFRSAKHERVIVVCPGRIENYVKYAELAYDLFQCG